MQQLSFFENSKTQKDLARNTFSHDGVGNEAARLALEDVYYPLLAETDKFNRQLVSFQANKTEVLHSWVKYREGFSANLVELLLQELTLDPGEVILDPFAGSATTLLVAKMLGIDAVGIELLPHCHLAWKTKANAFAYDLAELRHIRTLIEHTTPSKTNEKFPHLTITETAFLPQIEKELMAYDHWFSGLEISPEAKILCKFILMSLLEDLSYTRKDGQYLRWDGRGSSAPRFSTSSSSRSIIYGTQPIPDSR
jgi:site-specific DNA-methyltransferase (cytosine-N4-specific)